MNPPDSNPPVVPPVCPLTLLTRLEWCVPFQFEGVWHETCPECLEPKRKGHHPECALAKLLKGGDEPCVTPETTHSDCHSLATQQTPHQPKSRSNAERESNPPVSATPPAQPLTTEQIEALDKFKTGIGLARPVCPECGQPGNHAVATKCDGEGKRVFYNCPTPPAQRKTYPNPLNINFGHGQIIIAKWNDKDGRGIVFRDAGGPHPVGADCGLPPEKEHTPQEGEVYLHFANVKSARVVADILNEVIREWEATA